MEERKEFTAEEQERLQGQAAQSGTENNYYRQQQAAQQERLAQLQAARQAAAQSASAAQNTTHAYTQSQPSSAQSTTHAYTQSQPLAAQSAMQAYTQSQPSAAQSATHTAASGPSPTAQSATYTYAQRQASAAQNTARPYGQSTAHSYAHTQTRTAAPAAAPAKKKGRWPALVASALIFGLVAGSVMFGVNRIGNSLFPASSQSEAAVATQPQTTLALPTIGNNGENNSAAGKEEAGQTSGAAAATAAGTKTVAQVAEEAMPALVTIATVSVQEMQSFFGVQQYEAEGAGTGVIVGENDTELLIATNEHVISGARQVSVGFIDEEVVSAQVKGEDVDTDLAIVSVKKEDVPAETLAQIKIAVIGDSDALVLGEQVVAIGNALGVGQSVTSGYVSALGRELSLDDANGNFTSTDLIQTDAAINSGNSGGALLNMHGELIGINEAKSAYTSSGVTVDNVGYAIPMAKAQPILETLMNQATREKYGEDEQGYLGVSLANVSSDMAQMYNMPEGVCFTDVAQGSPAEAAGARKGDVLIEVEGRSILSADALTKEMQYHRSGDTIEMKVLRADNGEYKEQVLTVTLGTKDVLDSFYSEGQVPQGGRP